MGQGGAAAAAAVAVQDVHVWKGVCLCLRDQMEEGRFLKCRGQLVRAAAAAAAGDADGGQDSHRSSCTAAVFAIAAVDAHHTTSPPHIMRDLMQAAMPEAAAKLQLALTRGARCLSPRNTCTQLHTVCTAGE
eukprot:1158603-Pelagomonas_calceolata.AAC.7